MRAIWIGAGKRDEFNLDLGAVAFRRAVAAAGADEEAVRFELHDGGHSDAAWTVTAALSYLAERLA
jgi:hypothetical protein